jgi:hypothetical protein
MIGKIYFIALIAITLGMAGCSSGTKGNEQAEASKETSDSAQNDLPAMTVTLLNGNHVNTRELDGNIVIVLFQPDCDHCQREAAAIRERIALFKSYKLYFLSADQPKAVEKFASDYDLQKQPETYFAITTVEDVLRNFGPVDAPSVYIYTDRKLAHKFNGETPIERILQVL